MQRVDQDSQYSSHQMPKVSFDYRKATQILNLFALQEGGQINKMKALKLIHLSDRYHLRKYGRLITNDTYFAMKNGAVASATKDIAECNNYSDQKQKDYTTCFIACSSDRRLIMSKKETDSTVFSDSDLEVITYIWDKFGHLNQFELRDITHHYPEWAKNEKILKQRTRIPMDLNDFFEDSTVDVDKCYELSEEDRKIRREQLAEIIHLETLWR